jgi:hypothetical protein
VGKKWATILQISSQVAIVLIAVVALFVAVQSYRIAEKSYQLSYQSSLPAISAISETYSSEEENLPTDRILVRNGGGPITYIVAIEYALMEVQLIEMRIKTCIPLWGYFGDTDYSGNTQGLILTLSREGNLSDYLSISGDFDKAASEDGYKKYIEKTFILCVHYADYSGRPFWEYFRVNSYGSSPMTENEFREILDSAKEITEHAWSAGLSLFKCRELDGRELWNWYKAEILQD